jgi:hypothetical protein
MSSTSQQTILSTFNNAAGSQASGSGATGAAGGQSTSSSSTDQGLTDALTQATQVIDAQTEATSANTDALGVETQTKSSSSGSSVASDAMTTASSVLGGGLSLLPLVSIFTSLFGGGQSQPAPLVPYSMPPALNLQATTNDQDVTYGENGLPKTAGQTAANQQSINQPAANQQTAAQPATSAASSTQQITVQVQAMDSQSFLDHSDDIAQAVRQAMLNMSSLNDVVSSL